MTAPSWIRKKFEPRMPRTVRKSLARFRPGLEVLESRLMPAFTLGATALLEGPAGGTASDIVTGSGPWNSVANDYWLYNAAGGTGSGLATFSFLANTGLSRTGGPRAGLPIPFSKKIANC
jgi:hypothetical protein